MKVSRATEMIRGGSRSVLVARDETAGCPDLLVRRVLAIAERVDIEFS